MQADLEGHSFDVVMDEHIEVERTQAKAQPAAAKAPDPAAPLGPGVKAFREMIK